MNKHFDYIVLGGGAGGIVSAIKLATNGNSVAIIDENVSIGKKLLVTGNGRCNLTNENVTSGKYNRNIDKFFKRYGVNETLNFFKSLGLETYADDEGRIYPLSNSAKTVQFILQQKVKELGIMVFAGEKSLEAKKQSEKFVVKTDKNIFESENLVVATGGKNKDYLNSFKLKTIKEMPSLVALKTKENTKLLNGAKVNALVRASMGNSFKREEGEVLFKDAGLSGIVIFNISTMFARAKNFSGYLSLDLFPNKSEKDVLDMLMSRKHLKFNILEGVLCHELAIYVFERLGIDNKNADKMSDAEIKNVAKVLKHLEFQTIGVYDNNQVISGGIDIEELNDNLEHKKIKGLYFVGESVDVDGECGGYNLQWAWTSALIVGEGK